MHRRPTRKDSLIQVINKKKSEDTTVFALDNVGKMNKFLIETLPLLDELFKGIYVDFSPQKENKIFTYPTKATTYLQNLEKSIANNILEFHDYGRELVGNYLLVGCNAEAITTGKFPQTYLTFFPIDTAKHFLQAHERTPRKETVNPQQPIIGGIKNIYKGKIEEEDEFIRIINTQVPPSQKGFVDNQIYTATESILDHIITCTEEQLKKSGRAIDGTTFYNI